MYTEAEGFIFPYFQSFSQDLEHLQDLSPFHKYNARSNMVQTSDVSEYDLGGEGDLFKAPEPIIEESVMGLDSLTAAISMISGTDTIVTEQTIEASEMESIQREHMLNEAFYDCEKDILANSSMEGAFAGAPNVKVPALEMEDDPIGVQDRLIYEGEMQKSASSGCLISMEWINGGRLRPSFLDFQQMDIEAALGMRRAFSDGDIQNLGNGNTNPIHSPFDLQLTIGNCSIEERRQKLCRYRKKRSKRNFDRKIKYACRKALAENQPRIRGRFAKTEESSVSKTSKVE